MSLEAIVWALKVVELEDPVAKLVLIGLADHAHDDGTAAWPSQATLAQYVNVSVRTIRTKMNLLEERGLIRSGDQTLVAKLPANRRPHVWDLNMDGWAENISSQKRKLQGGKIFWAETNGSSGRKAVSDKPYINHPLPTGSASAPAPVDNSQKLIAEWIDNCPGGRPPGRVVGQVAKEVSLLLDEGIPYEQVRRGLQQWQSKRLHPSTLASVVHEVRTANGSSQPAKERVVCLVCQKPEVACRKMAQITRDDHAWTPTTVVA